MLMKVLIITDQHVFYKNNRYYAEYSFNCVLDRYVNAFKDVTLSARLGDLKAISRSATEVKGVNVIPCGNNKDIFVGKTRKLFRRIIPDYDFVILRLDSFAAYEAVPIIRKNDIPYMTECMSCAWDGLWNHSFLGKIIAPIMFTRMRNAVKHANYASYVTTEFLQQRYPCNNKSLAASNVMIDTPSQDVHDKRSLKIDYCNMNEVTLMTAGGVNIRYKGFQYVIQSIPELNKNGLRVKYLIVGNGDNSYLRSVAENCGVIDQVIFTGAVPHDKVLDLMDLSDIYIQPSLQEGLPRTVIEAMSRSCPAIGAKTAGIPELLPKECVFKRKSAEDITRTILKIWDKKKLHALSDIAFEESKKYANDVLNKRRMEYYQGIIDHFEKI